MSNLDLEKLQFKTSPHLTSNHSLLQFHFMTSLLRPPAAGLTTSLQLEVVYDGILL